MVDLLNLEDAELNAIMVKGDGHRSRDADRYAFMMENGSKLLITPFLTGISSGCARRHPCPAARGFAKRKENQRSSKLGADSLFVLR